MALGHNSCWVNDTSVEDLILDTVCGHGDNPELEFGTLIPDMYANSAVAAVKARYQSKIWR